MWQHCEVFISLTVTRLLIWSRVKVQESENFSSFRLHRQRSSNDEIHQISFESHPDQFVSENLLVYLKFSDRDWRFASSEEDAKGEIVEREQESERKRRALSEVREDNREEGRRESEIFLRNYGYDCAWSPLWSLFGSHEVPYCTGPWEKNDGVPMERRKKKGAEENPI